jgi:hypothetical protein
MSAERDAVLEDPLKRIEEAHDILAMLYRQMLQTMDRGRGVNIHTFNKYMLQYLDHPHTGIANNKSLKSSARGNIVKELFKPTITFKVFVKGVMFFFPIKAKFSIQMHWSERDISVHHIWIRLSDRPNYVKMELEAAQDALGNPLPAIEQEL